jgi:hypothetical protein
LFIIPSGTAPDLLHHLHRTPAVEGDLSDIELFAQPLDELLLSVEYVDNQIIAWYKIIN